MTTLTKPGAVAAALRDLGWPVSHGPNIALDTRRPSGTTMASGPVPPLARPPLPDSTPLLPRLPNAPGKAGDHEKLSSNRHWLQSIWPRSLKRGYSRLCCVSYLKDSRTMTAKRDALLLPLVSGGVQVEFLPEDVGQ